MALDRKNIDFLVDNTLPPFSSWEVKEGGASVLVDTATLPPNSYVSHTLNAEFNNGLDSAEYRKLTITMTSKPGLASNYTSIQQLLVKIHIVYSANTNSEIDETDYILVMSDDDLIYNDNDTFTLQRIIQTNSRALQFCNVSVINTGLNQIEVRDIRLQRSADINVGQMASYLKLQQTEMDPKSFNIYEPNMDNILDAIGIVINSGIEIKWKPIRQGNRLISIKTNFKEDMPVAYIPEYADMSTTTPGNTNKEEE